MLVACGLVVVGLVVPATTGSAAEPGSTITSGWIRWGLKSSFRTYVTGPLAQGSIDTGDGASLEAGGVVSFPVLDGTVARADGTATVDGSGWVRFAGHGGALELRLGRPRVVLTGGTGTLVVDVTSRSLAGGPPLVTDDVGFAALDLGAVTQVVSGSTRRWSEIPAVLTEEGAAAFSGFYPAGTPLDPVTVEVTVEDDSGGGPGGTAPPSDPGGGADPTPAPPPPPSPADPIAPADPVDGPGGSRTAVGPNGQRLTVSPARGLDPEGATVQVRGEGYDPTVGVYVALCVDRGPAAPPSPCLGGADTTGTGQGAVWFSNDPPPYAVGLTRPFGPAGSFEAELRVTARQLDDAGDVVIDCLDGRTRCVIASRADHTRPTDRSADVKVPVSFAGQEEPGEEAPAPDPPVLELDRSIVSPGDPLTATGRGFTPGEQVELTIHSTPRWVATPVADAGGELVVTFTVPADLEAGEHHLEARGVSSGLTARSSPFRVQAPTPATLETARTTTDTRPIGSAPVAPPAPSRAGATLPRTGRSVALELVAAGLIATGLALVAGAQVVTRHRLPRAPAPGVSRVRPRHP